MTSKGTDKRTAGLRAPWKPGQSGNPKGKKKGTVSLVAALKRRLREHPEEVEQLVATWVKQSKGGSAEHLRRLVEYIDGKVPDEKIVRVQIEHQVRVLLARFELEVAPLLGPDKAKEVMGRVAGYLESGE